MLVPAMLARMEQFGDVIRFWIDACQVGTFVQITIDAGESEIIEFVAAAVKSRNDVLDMENRQRRIILMKLAILAAVAGAFSNRGSRRRIHRLRGADHLKGLPLQNGDKLVRAHVALVFRTLSRGQLAFGGFPGEFFNARLQLG